MNDLKLIALDEDDLNIVSAHLQDAILRVGDMTLLGPEKKFVAIVSRFDWSLAQSVGARQGQLARHRAALRIERVVRARLGGIDLKRPDDVLVLLAVAFKRNHPEDPGGTLTMTFAGGSAVELHVECIEIAVADLGESWPSRTRPEHGLDKAPRPVKT
ncbi:MAG: DUF2948 family protein [Proteobacteria bacterium]|nr:DUF2948 family protein [Pseudomonadota bacterium]